MDSIKAEHQPAVTGMHSGVNSRVFCAVRRLSQRVLVSAVCMQIKLTARPSMWASTAQCVTLLKYRQRSINTLHLSQEEYSETLVTNAQFRYSIS